MSENEYERVNAFVDMILKSKRPLFLWGFDHIRVIEAKVFNP